MPHSVTQGASSPARIVLQKNQKNEHCFKFVVEASDSDSKVLSSHGKMGSISAVANANGKSSVPLSGIHEYVASQKKYQSATFEDEDHVVKPFISENKPPLDIKKSVIVSEHRITRNLKNITMSFRSGDSDHLVNSKG